MALVHTHFFSNTLGRQTSCDVILPQKAAKQIGMESAEREKSPVLWLLHGASDDETIWQRRTSIERYVSPLGLAVVMPSVEVSGYRNLSHGGRFYDYISKELPEIMRGFFNFSSAREDNYICGLSMGGAGAMKIGLANPDKYSVIGCLSAGMINHRLPDDTSNIDPEKNRSAF
ncbi:MAG: alpha/beta hydrolase, partial [Eubacteriales bacterium]